MWKDVSLIACVGLEEQKRSAGVLVLLEKRHTHVKAKQTHAQIHCPPHGADGKDAPMLSTLAEAPSNSGSTCCTSLFPFAGCGERETHLQNGQVPEGSVLNEATCGASAWRLLWSWKKDYALSGGPTYEQGEGSPFRLSLETNSSTQALCRNAR